MSDKKRRKKISADELASYFGKITTFSKDIKRINKKLSNLTNTTTENTMRVNKTLDQMLNEPLKTVLPEEMELHLNSACQNIISYHRGQTITLCEKISAMQEAIYVIAKQLLESNSHNVELLEIIKKCGSEHTLAHIHKMHLDKLETASD